MRLTQMAQKVKNQFLLVGSLDELKKVVPDIEAGVNQIKIRAIVGVSDIRDDASESDDVNALKRFLTLASRGDCTVDLKQIDKRSFNLVVVDGREAIWGESKFEIAERKGFWTNDPTQVGILKRSFENLWQEALPCESFQNEVRTNTLM